MLKKYFSTNQQNIPQLILFINRKNANLSTYQKKSSNDTIIMRIKSLHENKRYLFIFTKTNSCQGLHYGTHPTKKGWAHNQLFPNED